MYEDSRLVLVGGIAMEAELYEFIAQYIKPEMLIIIPVLLFLGWMMKQTPHVPDWLIPYFNTIFGIIGGIAITSSLIDGFIQGILASAMAVLGFNLYKQWKDKK